MKFGISISKSPNLEHQLSSSRSRCSGLAKSPAAHISRSSEGRDEHGAIAMIHGHDSLYRHGTRKSSHKRKGARSQNGKRKRNRRRTYSS